MRTGGCREEGIERVKEKEDSGEKERRSHEEEGLRETANRKRYKAPGKRVRKGGRGRGGLGESERMRG